MGAPAQNHVQRRKTRRRRQVTPVLPIYLPVLDKVIDVSTAQTGASRNKICSEQDEPVTQIAHGPVGL